MESGIIVHLLKIEIEKVVVTTEKALVMNPHSRGIRMDVFAADEARTVYNVEMQTSNKGNLPKRSRYYQAQIDTAQLRPGENFNQLHRSFVIFICTFDPFGSGRYTYTFEERCLEEDFPLGDETRKIYLNTKGSDSETDDETIHFLKYVEDSTGKLVEETDSAFVRRLHERVEAIKHDREMEERYMLFEELLADEKSAGQQLVLQLIEKMSADGLSEEIPKLCNNQDFYKEMLEKYQIKQ